MPVMEQVHTLTDTPSGRIFLRNGQQQKTENHIILIKFYVVLFWALKGICRHYGHTMITLSWRCQIQTMPLNHSMQS